MKWNKKWNCQGVPRVYESKERAITCWPNGKPKSTKGGHLLVKCGDCDKKFTIYGFGLKGRDEKKSNITHEQDSIELNGVFLNRVQLRKILRWAGY